MKTRSQAKKEQKIPKLNEDIFGIILKHVIRMEQDRVMKSFDVISNHFGHSEDYYSTSYYSCRPFHQYLLSNDTDISDRHVQWPKQLESNSQRLVYHSNIKLFSNYYYENDHPLQNLITSHEALGSILETYKHFSYVFNYHPGIRYGKMSPGQFIQELRNHLYAGKLSSSSLVEKLKKVK